MSEEPLSLLILEDDVQVAASLDRALRAHGYQVRVAHNAQQALEAARTAPLDLILCDVRMPGVDGLDALATLRTLQEGVRSIVMTGYASEDAPIRAIQNQVDDYLFKPVQLDKLLASIRRSAELCRVEKAGRRALEELRLSYLRLITSVVSLFWDRDRWFYEHSRRVAALAVALGTELGLLPSQLDHLELAALLHDLGLAFLERNTLLQERPLTDDEREALQQCPAQLQELLDQQPDLKDLQPILLHLREHFDGSGYPHRLQGQAIPLPARILAVAEAWDSLRHDRPHRPAHPFEEAAAILESQAGKQFDPSVVSLALELAREERELVDPRRLLARGDRAHESRWRTLLKLGSLLSASQPETARQALLESGELYRGLYGSDSLEVLVELGFLESSRPEEALRWLGRARLAPEMAQASPGVLERMARTLVLVGRVPAAREYLERGLARARELRHGALPGLLALKLSLDPSQEDVRRELEALSPAPVPVSAPLSELSVLAFGPPEVRGAASWPSRKALELFVYLAVMGRPVSQEQLAEALWPDQDASRKNVNTTVSRARQAVRAMGRPVLVFEHSFFSLEGVDCDVHQFDRWSREEPERALALYRADLLEGTWWEWAVEPRRVYREKAFALMSRLAREREGVSDWVGAQGFYQRMLDLDASREDAQLGLMRALVAQGLKEAAVRRYHDYCQILHRELGLSPGPEAQRLYDSLRT